MTELEQLRDLLAGIRAQANAALEKLDRVIAEVMAAEEADDEPDEPERPRTFGGR